MRIVTVLRGISGAGKSTYTRNNHPNAVVCSADNFFIGADGVYNFNRDLLGKAHDWCKRQFETALQLGQADVVVDNTNTTMREMKFYIDKAKQYDYTLNVVRLTVDPVIAAGRNLHGVPMEGVQVMQNRFQNFPGEIVIDTTPVAV